ncbi:hypothetical protein [Streptomyces sp. S1]|uniref:hypothetical protein n=1 Tax=Streptomyces sp. S1 TaxID=718288 RepID=UPI003D703EB4
MRGTLDADTQGGALTQQHATFGHKSASGSWKYETFRTGEGLKDILVRGQRKAGASHGCSYGVGYDLDGRICRSASSAVARAGESETAGTGRWFVAEREASPYFGGTLALFRRRQNSGPTGLDGHYSPVA